MPSKLLPLAIAVLLLSPTPPQSDIARVEQHSLIDTTDCVGLIAEALRTQGSLHWYKPAVLDSVEIHIEGGASASELINSLRLTIPNERIRGQLADDVLIAIERVGNQAPCADI